MSNCSIDEIYRGVCVCVLAMSLYFNIIIIIYPFFANCIDRPMQIQ